MLLSEDLITKFRNAYKEEYGEDIAPDVAEAELLGLAELVKIANSRKRNGNEDDNTNSPAIK